MREGDLFKPKKKPLQTRSPRKEQNIPPESKKRKKEHKTYLEQIKLFWKEAVNDGTNYCFFCGEKMESRDNVHHMKGRTGNYYLDKEFWGNAHNECHGDYHFKGVEWLMQQFWYKGFLDRLRLKSEELYQKEFKKQDKSQKINPILDFDEE
jgi:hypothetical protein